MTALVGISHDEARTLVRAAVEREAERLSAAARDPETSVLLAHAARSAGAAADLALVRDQVEAARRRQEITEGTTDG